MAGRPEHRSVTARRPGLWQVLVPVIALLAGLLLATTAHTARGTDLRSAGRRNITDLIRQAEAKVATDDNEVKQLQRNIADATNLRAQSDQQVAGIANG